MRRRCSRSHVGARKHPRCDPLPAVEAKVSRHCDEPVSRRGWLGGASLSSVWWMKRTVLFSVLLLLLSVVDGRSQVLRWAYTNALPAEFTNGYNLITRSTYDGAGGSVWLINVLPSDPFPAPFSGFSFTRILWLNKNGRPIYTNDMGTDYLDVNVSFVATTNNCRGI